MNISTRNVMEICASEIDKAVRHYSWLPQKAEIESILLDVDLNAIILPHKMTKTKCDHKEDGLVYINEFINAINDPQNRKKLTVSLTEFSIEECNEEIANVQFAADYMVDGKTITVDLIADLEGMNKIQQASGSVTCIEPKSGLFFELLIKGSLDDVACLPNELYRNNMHLPLDYVFRPTNSDVIDVEVLRKGQIASHSERLLCSISRGAVTLRDLSPELQKDIRSEFPLTRFVQSGQLAWQHINRSVMAESLPYIKFFCDEVDIDINYQGFFEHKYQHEQVFYLDGSDFGGRVDEDIIRQVDFTKLTNPNNSANLASLITAAKLNAKATSFITNDVSLLSISL
jgi:hypothetical protein